MCDIFPLECNLKLKLMHIIKTSYGPLLNWVAKWLSKTFNSKLEPCHAHPLNLDHNLNPTTVYIQKESLEHERSARMRDLPK